MNARPMNKNEARELFFRWLAVNNPALYAPVATQLKSAQRLAGLDGWADTLVSALTTVGTAYVAKKTADKQLSAQKKAADADRATALQAELLNVNLQRAQAGLPPVDANGRVVASASLPALPTYSQASVAARAQDFLGSVPTVVYLAGAVLVVYLLARK